MQPSDSLPLKKDYYIGLIFPVLAEGHSSVTLFPKNTIDKVKSDWDLNL